MSSFYSFQPSVSPFSATREGGAETSSSSHDDISPTLSDASRLKNMLGKKMGALDEAWFTPLSFSLTYGRPQTLHIECPHPLFYRWFCQKGRTILEKTARDLLGSDLTIVYGYAQTNEAGFHSPQPAPPVPVESDIRKTGPRFDQFIVGGRNRDLLRLFRRSIQSSPCTILLLGASGTGKSHLLRAAETELQHLKNDILFLPCREFIAQFRRAPELLHQALMTASAVLIDDIQLLEHHPDIQLELAAQLDELEGKTFFLASYQTDEQDSGGDKLLPTLYDRLCSYLALGLSEPDLDVRLRFAQDQMRNVGLPEHRSTALFVARRCLRLRHIRGVLEQLGRIYEQNRILPSPEELSSLIGRSGTPQPPDTDHILAVVASRYGCSSDQLRENTREKHLTLPRQIAMFLCRELLGESYPSLGLIFGGKDHSTVMYAVKKIEKMKVTNKDMHIRLTELTRQCQNSAPRRESSI